MPLARTLPRGPVAHRPRRCRIRASCPDWRSSAMRILIANDDGIYSPGIAAAAKAASKFGDVRIVAPDVEQSSASHAITASRPLSYRRTPLPGGFEAYRVNG